MESLVGRCVNCVTSEGDRVGVVAPAVVGEVGDGVVGKVVGPLVVGDCETPCTVGREVGEDEDGPLGASVVATCIFKKRKTLTDVTL